MLGVDVHYQRGAFTLDAQFELGNGVTGLFGPSAAGKTTLFHLIAGLDRPQRGRISLDDNILFDSSSRQNEPVHRRRVGVVFQEARLFPHLSVAGNLRYGRRHPEEDERTISFADVVELLELGDLLPRRVGGLSGGERQRVALGRAILAAPKLLLLDEPLASLDRRRRQQILPFLRGVRDTVGIPMIYVSHDLTDLLQLTDRLLVMNEGSITGHGRYIDLLRETPVLDVVHDLGIVNVLRLVLRERDDPAGLTRFDVATRKPADIKTSAGGVIAGPPIDRQKGDVVHASVRPEDIALSLEQVSGISIQNQVPGRVVRVTPHAGRSLAEVSIGDDDKPLLVEVSLKTVREMKIEPGRRVHCLIKSNAVRYLDGTGAGTQSTTG